MALTDPEIVEIIRGKRGMLQGVESCVRQQCLVSAVALIYSTIDALAAITRPIERPRTDRRIFMKWVERYMKPEDNLGCTAADVYGARCGVLHTYSPESDLMREGDAKALIYRWRTGPEPDPALLPRAERPIVLCVEDLVASLKSAVESFLYDIEHDRDLNARVSHHIKSLLCYRPWSVIRIRVAA